MFQKTCGQNCDFIHIPISKTKTSESCDSQFTFHNFGKQIHDEINDQIRMFPYKPRKTIIQVPKSS